jgi:predicted metal-binding protein
MDPKRIIVRQWVRMKCTFGCEEYGHSGSCPPNTPSVAECERFFKEYNDAVVFHFRKAMDRPEDRHAWTRKVNRGLLELEREVFLSGQERTFLLFMDSCFLCKECAEQREGCLNPKLSRPAPEAMAVDVFSTVRALGFPIEVKTDDSQAMDRYAFLMVR